MYLALTVSVRVLPDPGPAITRDGPSTAVIAALCSALIFSGEKSTFMNRVDRRAEHSPCRYLRKRVLSHFPPPIPGARIAKSHSRAVSWGSSYVSASGRAVESV